MLDTGDLMTIALCAAQIQTLCSKTLDLLNYPPHRLAVVHQGFELAKAISDIVDPEVKEQMAGGGLDPADCKLHLMKPNGN